MRIAARTRGGPVGVRAAPGRGSRWAAAVREPCRLLTRASDRQRWNKEHVAISEIRLQIYIILTGKLNLSRKPFSRISKQKGPRPASRRCRFRAICQDLKHESRGEDGKPPAPAGAQRDRPSRRRCHRPLHGWDGRCRRPRAGVLRGRLAVR